MGKRDGEQFAARGAVGARVNADIRSPAHCGRGRVVVHCQNDYASLAYALGKRMLPVGRSVATAAPFPVSSPRMAYMVTSAGCDKGEPNKPGFIGVPSPSPGMYPA